MDDSEGRSQEGDQVMADSEGHSRDDDETDRSTYTVSQYSAPDNYSGAFPPWHSPHSSLDVSDIEESSDSMSAGGFVSTVRLDEADYNQRFSDNESDHIHDQGNTSVGSTRDDEIMNRPIHGNMEHSFGTSDHETVSQIIKISKRLEKNDLTCVYEMIANIDTVFIRDQLMCDAIRAMRDDYWDKNINTFVILSQIANKYKWEKTLLEIGEHKKKVKYVLDAIKHRNADTLNLLVLHGYAVNNEEEKEFSPLHLLFTDALNAPLDGSLYSYSRRRNKITHLYETLCSHPSNDPSKTSDGFKAFVTKKDFKGRTALHYLAQTSLTEIAFNIFENKKTLSANINWLDIYGCSPLFYAAKSWKLERFGTNEPLNHEDFQYAQKSMFAILFDRYIERDIIDDNNYERKHLFSINQEGLDKRTPLHQLAKFGNWQLLEYLERRYDLYDKNPYHSTGRTCADRLFFVNSDGFTLLDSAAVSCKKQFTRWVLKKSIPVDIDDSREEKERTQQARSSCINRQYCGSKNLMSIACEFGRPSRVTAYIKMLISLGGDPRLLDGESNNLMHAVSSSKGSPPTPLTDSTILCGRYQAIRDRYQADSWEVLDFINAKEPRSIFNSNEKGELPLHVAVRCCKSSTVASLLTIAIGSVRKSLDAYQLHDVITRHVNHKNRENQSPLDLLFLLMDDYKREFSRMQKQWLPIKLQRCVKIAEFLIASGAKVDKSMMSAITNLSLEYNHTPLLSNLIRIAVISTSRPIPYFLGSLNRIPLEIYQKISNESVFQELLDDIEKNKEGVESACSGVEDDEKSDNNADSVDDMLRL